MMHYFFWQPFPFIRYTLLLIVGIVIANTFLLPLQIGYWLLLPSIVYIGLWLFNKFLPILSPTYILGLIGGLALIAIGIQTVIFNSSRHYPNHLINQSQSINYYTASVSDNMVDKGNYCRGEVEIEAIKGTNGTWKKVTGKVTLYIRLKSHDNIPVYGDRLLIKGQPQLLKSTTNPNAFDYKAFQIKRGVYHQHFVDESNYFSIKIKNHFSIIRSILSWRQRTVILIKNKIPDPQLHGIILSLVFGLKDSMEEQVKTAYNQVGISHILAVSGLHVGIIYLILSTLLGFLKKNRPGRWLFITLNLSILWAYVIVTGMSPSVTRAVVMFSFILLGDALRRKGSVYNNLALAAMVLLISNPNNLYEVGFQLSFIAVFGIVYFQPRLYKLFVFHLWPIDKIWQLSTVTIAAQFVTFPITLFYFHQFPIYFMISNLIAIPAASFILCLSGLSIIELTWLSSEWITILLGKSVAIFNYCILYINNWPGGVVEGIYVTRIEVFMIYIQIVLSVILLVTKKPRVMIYLGIILIAFLGVRLSEILRVHRQSYMIFYDVPNALTIDVIEGKNHEFLIQKQSKMKKSDLVFQLSNNRIYHGLLTNDLHQTSFNNFIPDSLSFKIISWQTHDFLFLQKSMNFINGQYEKMEVDFLVISNNALKDVDLLLNHITFQTLIISNLNTKKYARMIQDQCEKRNIAVHNCAINGALVLNFKKRYE